MQPIDAESELERLSALDPQERLQELEKLIEELERRLDSSESQETDEGASDPRE